jgi:Trk K+ transport system NAD-binding subunit
VIDRAPWAHHGSTTALSLLELAFKLRFEKFGRNVLFYLTRLFNRLALLSNWATPVAVVLFVFVTSWPLMTLAEPAGSEIVQPGNYWWYFLVTTTTVGYGDFFPKTGAGHAVGAYIIGGGIATLTTVFTKLASVLEQRKGRRMQGAMTVNATGHVVLLGYTPGRSERIAGQLIAEGAPKLVLCAWDDVATHPMPEQPIDFVRGDLNDENVLRRAGVDRARTVLVDVRDDNEALAVAVTVDHVTDGSHVVITLRDMERAQLLHYVDPKFRCVQWHTPWMITEELTSPGIAEVYTDLMTPGGANTYSVALPYGPVLVEHCQLALGREHHATLLAVQADGHLIVNPDWRTELPAGATLYYVSPNRLTTDDVAQTLRKNT